MKTFNIEIIDLINGAFTAWLDAGEYSSYDRDEHAIFERMQDEKEMVIKIDLQNEEIQFIFAD